MKNIFTITLLLFFLCTTKAYALVGGIGFDDFAIVLIIFIPFIINYHLAKSRGKSASLMLLLTLIFSWIVTLCLALMSPAKITPQVLNGKCEICDSITNDLSKFQGMNLCSSCLSTRKE